MLKQSVKVSINGNANKFISKLNTVVEYRVLWSILYDQFNVMSSSIKIQSLTNSIHSFTFNTGNNDLCTITTLLL